MNLYYLIYFICRRHVLIGQNRHVILQEKRNKEKDAEEYLITWNWNNTFLDKKGIDGFVYIKNKESFLAKIATSKDNRWILIWKKIFISKIEKILIYIIYTLCVEFLKKSIRIFVQISFYLYVNT